jgi:hypothetical protein
MSENFSSLASMIAPDYGESMGAVCEDCGENGGIMFTVLQQFLFHHLPDRTTGGGSSIGYGV